MSTMIGTAGRRAGMLAGEGWRLADLHGVAGVAGAAVVAHSYRVAAGGGDGHAEFWVGMLLLVGTGVAAAVRRGSSERERNAAIAYLAVVSSIPKLLRTGTSPGFSDEFAHLRELLNLTERWGGSESALVRMASEFPGMHVTFAAVAETLGVRPEHAAAGAIIILHAALLLGVQALLRDITRDGRTAAIGAAVYATNPSYLLFDMQLAYETFALPLAVWTLVAARRGMTGDRTWQTIAVLTGAAVAVSHHLTALLLAATLAAAAAVSARGQARRLGGVAAAVAGTYAVWTATYAEGVGAYLAPSLPELGAVRTAFEGSAAPWYEQAAGLAYPMLLAGAAAVGVMLLHRKVRTLPGFDRATVGLAVAYFASLPVALLPGSAEGARRTWAWTTIGVAYTAGTYLATRPQVNGRAGRAAVGVAAAAVAATLAVGGVAAGQDVTYRFPGPVATGADARSYTATTATVADIVTSLADSGDRIVADRYARGDIAVRKDVTVLIPSKAWPAWDVLYADDPVDGYVALRSGDVRWYVVDLRMFDRLPARGFWYTTEEVGTALPVAEGRLGRITCVGRTAAAVGSYLVIELDAAAVADAAASGGCR